MSGNNINVSVKGDAPTLGDFKSDIPMMVNKDWDNHLDVEQIKLMIYQLLSDTNCQEDDRLRQQRKTAELRGKYQKKYEGLMMRYPSLFSMVLESGREFDLVQFEQMMAMISKVRSKEVEEGVASRAFGEKMVDKYVKPNLKN